MFIAYTFNRYYLKATEISIFSLLSSRTGKTPLKIILVIENDLKDEDLDTIKKMTDEAENCSMEIYRPEELFKDSFCFDEDSCAPSEGIQVSFYRLYLSKLLGSEDRCLFLDSDLVVRKDLAELYDTDLKNVCFAGVTDRLCLDKKELERIRSYKVKNGMYINSGVIMMNLKRLRDTSLDDRLLDMAYSRAFPYLDQDVINFCDPDEIRLTDKTYNVFPDDEKQEWISFIAEDEIDNALNDPAIVHYIGPEKPWEYRVSKGEYWKQAEDEYNEWLKAGKLE